MSSARITYSCKDILRYQNSSNLNFEVHNKEILISLRRSNSSGTVNNGLLHRKTRRGSRAGRRYHKKRSLCDSNPSSRTESRPRRPPTKLPSILYTNCRSLTQWKLEELSVYVNIHKPDLICLTETWLDSAKEDAKCIDGYKNFWCHRKNRIGGGVGILTSEKLTVTQLTSHTTSTFSAVWILLHLLNVPVIIGCVYHPPNADNNATLDYLSDTMLKLLQKRPNAHFIITGDLNHLPITNLMEQCNLKNLVNFNTRNEAMLDYVLTDINEYEPAIELSPLANNDHCSILVKGTGLRSKNYSRFKKRIITPQRKAAVNAAIAEQDWISVFDAPDVHSKVDALHLTVEAILEKHCPYRLIKQRKDRPPWITNAIVKTIEARDKAHRKKCKSWKVLRALVQRRIRSSKRSFIKSRLNSNQNTKEWWTTLNSITNKNKTAGPSEKHVINDKILSTEEFCSALNDYYISVGGEPRQNVKMNSINDIDVPLQHFSIGEIKLLMRKLDPSKCTSTDDFPTWLSKDCIEDVCIPMHNIINCMLTSGEYPDRWKRAQVTPTPKCSSPSEFKHYRPISLLYHLGKVAEQAIIEKLRYTIDKVIKPNQYAYQPKVSTTDALLQYVDDITSQLDNPAVKYVQGACLDFSKAFDRLQPAIVVDKMLDYGFNPNIVKLIDNFLRNRYQCVKFNGVFSDYLPINVGSPQGTKLGPLLWIIYVNDLEVDSFFSVKYADDTTFYRPSHTHDQSGMVCEAIHRTQDWSNSNSMLLNAEKTVVMNTSLSSRRSYSDDIFIDDTVLSPVDHTKLLGVIIDDKLSFSQHVEFLVTKSNSRMFLMRKLKTLGLNATGLKTFYETNIRSVLVYGSPAWYTLLSQQSKDTLEAIQRSATRIIFPDHTYDDRRCMLTVPSLNDFIFSLCQNHFDKILTDQSHPLFPRITMNNCKRSLRASTIFRPDKARTQKRAKSFFQFFMRFSNNRNIYIE